jgi:ribonuclease P protein component
LPRARIIGRKSTLFRIRQDGRRRVTSFVQLAVMVQTDPAHGTVAFITPRSLGSAVVRNKIRRRMREIYRRQLAPTGRAGFYYVWTARSGAVSGTFEQLRDTMLQLWKHAPWPSAPSAPGGSS